MWKTATNTGCKISFKTGDADSGFPIDFSTFGFRGVKAVRFLKFHYFQLVNHIIVLNVCVSRAHNLYEKYVARSENVYATVFTRHCYS